jgi:thiamine transporter
MEKIFAGLAALSAHPTALISILAVLFLLLALLKMRKIRLTPYQMACAGIMLALSVLLTAFPFYQMPNGGSVTLGGMLPLMLIGFAYGPEVGMFTGFTYSMINLMMHPFILHPIQVLLDYPLPFMALGLTGYFRQRKLTGMIFAVGVRLLCHFLSGVIFFGSYAPAGTSVYVYSLVTNLTYLAPNLVICLVLYKLLPMDRFIGIMRRQ